MDHVFYCIAIVVVSSVVIVSMMRGQWVEVSLEILFPVFLLFFLSTYHREFVFAGE